MFVVIRAVTGFQPGFDINRIPPQQVFDFDRTHVANGDVVAEDFVDRGNDLDWDRRRLQLTSGQNFLFRGGLQQPDCWLIAPGHQPFPVGREGQR